MRPVAEGVLRELHLLVVWELDGWLIRLVHHREVAVQLVDPPILEREAKVSPDIIKDSVRVLVLKRLGLLFVRNLLLLVWILLLFLVHLLRLAVLNQDNEQLLQGGENFGRLLVI